ncbi:hypothetical protein V8G54_019682 [Vigna mungo]|uniref:Uncharacterized protein n=1 Tax=Vigna mungo TaxID=3915 RepID=A0AAQ3NCC5_VIGMU
MRIEHCHRMEKSSQARNCTSTPENLTKVRIRHQNRDVRERPQNQTLGLWVSPENCCRCVTLSLWLKSRQNHRTERREVGEQSKGGNAKFALKIPLKMTWLNQNWVFRLIGIQTYEKQP